MITNEFEKYAIGHLGMGSHGLSDYARAMRSNVLAMTPNVIEERHLNVTAIDVFSRLMVHRIIFFGLPIDDYVANILNAQLLFLESADPAKDIYIYVNSPGGSVYAGLGVYDVMQYVQPDISTVCTGMAASMAAVLLSAGAAGKRVGLPHSRVMIHQPMGGAQGQASDILIVAEQIQKLKSELYEILAAHTGQPFDKISKDSDRDFWMKSDEAKEYGIIDEIITSHKKKQK